MPIQWRSVDPALLNNGFAADIDKLLRESPHTWVVTHGYRSLAEQEALWLKYKAGGPKAAPPGKSPHNYGLAVDVVLDGSPAPGLQPDWNIAHDGWLWLFDAIWRHPRLHSGRSFHDADHIERLGWKAHI